jgi:predicted secreted protein
MAIQNASDLLVYKKVGSSNVAQVTKVFIKSDGNTPLSATGNVKLIDAVDGSGSSIADQTITTGTNTDAGVANSLRAAINALAGYTCSTVSLNDGGRLFTVTNNFAGDLSEDKTFKIIDGTSAIEAGAIDLTVTTAGSNANDYEPIAFSTSASISFTRDLRDITTKDSAGWSESAIGLKSFEQFFEDLGSGENITLRFKQRTSGGSDEFYQGSAIVSSLSVEAGVEDNLTYSVSFTGTANVTTGTD